MAPVPSAHEGQMTDVYLEGLRQRVRRFAEERDWGQFHTPKNLASAVSVEAGELLEQFQWAETGNVAELSSSKRDRIADEIADVLIYLVRLADVMAIDLPRATDMKLANNALKYPVALAKGKSGKYDEL
jgi:NTP pyrophosphatase (non-canonical NTP hydrolase)